MQPDSVSDPIALQLELEGRPGHGGHARSRSCSDSEDSEDTAVDQSDKPKGTRMLVFVLCFELL